MKITFIVGMYKSGTSWLLQCLATHPKIIGVTELDLVRAVNGTNDDKFESLPNVDVLKNILARPAFLGLVKDFVDAKDGVYDLPANQLIDSLRAQEPLTMKEINNNHLQKFYLCLRASKLMNPFVCYDIAYGIQNKYDGPIRFDDLDDSCALNLINGIRKGENAIEKMNAIVQTIERFAGDQEMLVFKGADQIARFDLLEEWLPEAKKIVIVRDGRDACLSAYHFRKLMIKKNSAFTSDNPTLDYVALLKGWVNRADMVLQHSKNKNLKIIRYEDLHTDFKTTMFNLSSFIGVDISRNDALKMKLSNSFLVQTGRPPGKGDEAIKRKGEVAEWTYTLDQKTKDEAWRVAGKQLQSFGYSVDSDINPLPEID